MASFQDAICVGDVVRGVSLRSTPGYWMPSLRDGEGGVPRDLVGIGYPAGWVIFCVDRMGGFGRWLFSDSIEMPEASQQVAGG